jgi:hypothetical protein
MNEKERIALKSSMQMKIPLMHRRGLTEAGKQATGIKRQNNHSLLFFHRPDYGYSLLRPLLENRQY